MLTSKCKNQVKQQNSEKWYKNANVSKQMYLSLVIINISETVSRFCCIVFHRNCLQWLHIGSEKSKRLSHTEDWYNKNLDKM